MRILRSGAQSYDVAKVSRETGVTMRGDKRLTIQSAKDDSDINVIVRRFGLTGQMPAMARMPSYGDFTGVSDFKTAMNVVRESEQMFLELPSNLRKRFGNDPQAYLEFVSNPENIDELRKWGLAKPKEKVIIPVADIPPKEKGNEGNPDKRTGKAAKASGGSDGDVTRD